MENIKKLKPHKLVQLLFVIFISLLIQLNSEPAYGEWTLHIIEPKANESNQIAAHDIDNDGDMDLFVTQEYAGKIVFYENNNNFSWTKHPVGSSAGQPVGVDIADLNQDGYMDIVVGFYGADLFAWYKNDGGDPYYWEKDTIDNSYDGAVVVRAVDINGDGATDIVGRWFNSGEFVWCENNLPIGWTTHIIHPNMPSYGYFDIGDINNDNQPDIVRSYENGDRVVLFKNNLPDSNWSQIIVDPNMPKTRCSHFGDIDNDGDLDIVSGARGSDISDLDVAWYENDGSGSTWFKHPITSDLSDAIWIDLVDIDNDDSIDVVVHARADKSIILLINKNGGQLWTKYTVEDHLEYPHYVFAYDIDLDGDFDIVPSRTDNFADFVWYENPLGSAHAVSLDASPTLVKPQSDSLIITAVLDNPDNHPVHVFAVIEGDQSGFIDTLQLYDDGLHGDSLAQDNLWVNKRITTDLSEEAFKVDLITYDSTRNDTLGFNPSAWFFTLGPVKYVSHTTPTNIWCNKDVPEPGGCLNLKLSLTNKSLEATAKNISVELISLDSLISFAVQSCDFPDIPAGDSSVSQNNFTLLISEDWPGDETIPIQVNISSYGIVCWQDTFSIHVDTSSGTNVYNVKAPIVRIYPNPADDILTIEFERVGLYEIEITSINGKTLYTGQMEGPSHQIDLSSFQKGIYLITVRSKDFIETRKLIKMKSVK